MNRKSQPTLEIILEDYSFISVRHWEGLTTGWPPSGGDTVWKNARHHHPIELRVPHLRWHPFLIAAGSGGRLLRLHRSLLRRHFSDLVRNLVADARVDVNWEEQELRRKM